MPVSDLDITRSAHLWIQQHGVQATATAREMVEEMRRRGNVERADVWLRIIVAIGADGRSTLRTRPQARQDEYVVADLQHRSGDCAGNLPLKLTSVTRNSPFRRISKLEIERMSRFLAIAGMLALVLSAQQASAQLYVRGDLGGAFSNNTDFTDVDSSAPDALLGPGVQISGDPGNSVIFGAGVGYRFTPLLRADVTFSYMPSFTFKGTDNLGIGSTETADIRSFVALVNGYVDLNGLAPGRFGAFQPYVDFGIGFANNDVDTTHASLFGVSATVSGDNETSFAWGAGAGIAYPVAHNVLLDLAYKYLDLGEMRTGTTLAVEGVTAQVGATKADLQAHTVTLGVRVSF